MDRATELELLSDALGFTPKYFISVIVNAVNEIANGCVDSLEKFLMNLHRKDNQRYPLADIKSGMSKFELLLFTTIDKYCELFELYMYRNIFLIPELLQPQVDRQALSANTPVVEDATNVHRGNDAEINAVIRDIEHELSVQRTRQHQVTAAKQMRAAAKEVLAQLAACVGQEPGPQVVTDMVAILSQGVTKLYRQAEGVDQLSETLEGTNRVRQRLEQLNRQFIS